MTARCLLGGCGEPAPTFTLCDFSARVSDRQTAAILTLATIMATPETDIDQ